MRKGDVQDVGLEEGEGASEIGNLAFRASQKVHAICKTLAWRVTTRALSQTNSGTGKGKECEFRNGNVNNDWRERGGGLFDCVDLCIEEGSRNYILLY
jgi:hypothetical protein